MPPTTSQRLCLCCTFYAILCLSGDSFFRKCLLHCVFVWIVFRLKRPGTILEWALTNSGLNEKEKKQQVRDHVKP